MVYLKDFFSSVLLQNILVKFFWVQALRFHQHHLPLQMQIRFRRRKIIEADENHSICKSIHWKMQIEALKSTSFEHYSACQSTQAVHAMALKDIQNKFIPCSCRSSEYNNIKSIIKVWAKIVIFIQHITNRIL